MDCLGRVQDIAQRLHRYDPMSHLSKRGCVPPSSCPYIQNPGGFLGDEIDDALDRIAQRS